MSVMLFIIVVIASFIIVRIGAIAFQLTGLEWSLAKFQSLSCFSGTGVPFQQKWDNYLLETFDDFDFRLA